MEYWPHELPSWETPGTIHHCLAAGDERLRQPERQVLDTLVDAGSLGLVRGAELALRWEVLCSAGYAIERCSGTPRRVGGWSNPKEALHD